MNAKSFRVLVANDDGIFSPGIKALALAMSQIADVVVVAPDVEQSAVGHGITIRRPLRFKHTASAGFGEIPAYRVDGTPADCVVLGIHLLGKPDLVVSGINLGPNLGDDLTHSGTVAAAIEGLALGVPSIAFSQQAGTDGEYDFAGGAAFATHLAGQVLERGLPPNLQNTRGDTLLMLAAYHSHTGAVGTLLDHGADPDILNDQGQTPLMGAAFRGDQATAELLVARGAGLDVSAPGGKTALMMAAMFNRTAMLDWLLDLGADPSLRDAGGATAADAARVMGAADTAARLDAIAAAAQQEDAESS